MPNNWVGTWMAAQQLTEPGNMPPPPGFVDATLRQVIRVSLGGKLIRLRFSNEFGTTTLTLSAVRVARAGKEGAIQSGTEKAVTFGGNDPVEIAPGAHIASDPLAFDLPPLSDLAVTIHTRIVTSQITGHPGSRCTSYLWEGNDVATPDFKDAIRVDHWYFLSGLEVMATPGTGAVVTLGDSITDGRGSPTNGNGRWTDFLARRLQTETTTSGRVAVLNAGIGGNCVVRGGLGPPALKRIDRDVLAQPGARWLILFEGINDLGTRSASDAELIAAYKHIITRAKARGLRVYGATILPCGQSFYFTPELEADRQTINAWVRTSGDFDAVIDFDAALRDAKDPSRLSARAESPDHLHPANGGYKVLAEAIALQLFVP
ncbi:MAG: SGNH/GDSL hydrolase family protein [Fibrella sp.]|nr:SGNH/GDSL hydrolase family protein [Armatimonadota bacterium]